MNATQDPAAARVHIVTVSDRSAAGTREDGSGPALAERVGALGMQVVGMDIVADGVESVAGLLRELVSAATCDLILTTGGSGLSPRDWTPEATRSIAQREIPGLMELARARCIQKTAFAALGRGVAVTRERCLIINLPGNPKAASETLDALADVLPHAIAQVSLDPRDCDITGGAEAGNR